MVDAPAAGDLTAAEARVLGALMEKQLTTPDAYPLTLKALTTACNQTSNRDPVTAYFVASEAIDQSWEPRAVPVPR